MVNVDSVGDDAVVAAERARRDALLAGLARAVSTELALPDLLSCVLDCAV